jgi:phosphoribosylformylglycinamidine synthase subunit PurQ / glutaminase
LKYAVVVFPGSNCDHDMFYALKKVMKFQVDFIWHQDVSLDNYNAVVLPGGFSYGDYLRAGAVARFSPIMNEIIRFAGKGKPVLGICNGFQILTECGLLPGALMRNQDLRFVCRHVYIRTENSDTRFTSFLQPKSVLKIPIAHGEGNYFIDQEGLKALADNQQIIFRYVDQNGDITPEANPNGSLDNIAGIINKQGNVLGMMPHPERAMELLLGSDDGRYIFESLKN